jgi:hypothetical protein
MEKVARTGGMKVSYGKLYGSTAGATDSNMNPLEETMKRPQATGGAVHGYFKRDDHCNG